MMDPEHSSSIPAAGWVSTASGNARLRLSVVAAKSAPVLRMDFDFNGGGGFVVARRALDRAMPKEYAVRFRLRGRGAVNNLEIKLIDPSGLNVWRCVHKDLRLPPRFRAMQVESREIEFAWGPASGSDMTHLGFIEFAVVAGEGGQGSLWLADLVIEDRTPSRAPEATASSAVAMHPAWRPLPEDLRPWIVIDSFAPRLFGGLTIDWLNGAPSSGFRVRASNTGRRWKTVYRAARAAGERSNVYLPGLTTRYLRLELNEPIAGAVLSPQSFEFSRSVHAFWHHIVAAEARGWNPRWLHREQSLWTPAGIANGSHCALLNTDGMVEAGKGSCSIEPMLLIDGRLLTWAEVAARQELLGDWMPVPSVIWETEAWRLRITAAATTTGALRVRYRIENLTEQGRSVRLFLLLRPFQVTPPWQNFRNLGGVSRICDIVMRDGTVRVNGSTTIIPQVAADGFGAMSFDEGFVAARLAEGRLPAATEVHDAFGFATGVLDFSVPLAAGESAERVIDCVTAADGASADGQSSAATGATSSPIFDWSGSVAEDLWSGSGWCRDVVRTAYTATTHVLVTRSGPALQPGPRRYTRSWIRDGAMMSAALLRMGHRNEVREYIAWYAPHQRADGFVPCCVDDQGVDWLVEHDSHGQLLALSADYHRFAADRPFLEQCWGHIERAAECIDALLGEDGLLPISVSHEGYLAQPVHAYWDDFWALRGLRDAVYMAGVLGHEDAAARWRIVEERLAKALFASIEATRRERSLDFIPGSIEWADFDPTATANALYLLDVPEALDRRAVEHTFDKYLADWRSKRAGTVVAANYTPYEIRIIGAMVRLGRRNDALELLRFFLSDRRPLPWNQWPEIAWRDAKAPAHLGDLPHTWIAAEYVLAVRSLFAYEREVDQSLVLAAGLDAGWLEGSGVSVKGMPTIYGSLDYSLRRVSAGTIQFEIAAGVAAKLVLRPPLAAALRAVSVNGAPYARFDADSVIIAETPATVLCICAEP